MALTIWNECRGIEWEALPVLAEIHGVSDIETLIVELIAIREFQGALDG